MSKGGDGMGGDPIYFLHDNAWNYCPTKTLSQSLSALSLSIKSPLHCTAHSLEHSRNMSTYRHRTWPSSPL